MIKFNLKLYTTAKINNGRFPVEDLTTAVQTINANIRGAYIERFNMEQVNWKKLKPVITEEKDIDWKWFVETFTKDSVGYNIVVFHMTENQKRKYGIRKNLNGCYRADKDDVLEIWLSADQGERAKKYARRYSEFKRVLIHEILHGLYRKNGLDTNLVHFFDYEQKNVELGLRIVDFRKR
jgi:hypothetical protein